MHKQVCFGLDTVFLIYIYITASKKDTMYGDIWLGTSGCGQDTFGGQSL
jgi:hypothetical protein